MTTMATSEGYVVVAEAVSRRFGNLDALLPTTLRVRTGERLAIMGPSGCGKSTLLNLLGALDRPTSGRVVFSGKALTYSDREVTELHRHGVGFIFQGFALIASLTAIENVELTLVARSEDARNRLKTAARLLQDVGLEHAGSRYPEELSGRQRQRVAIARALAHQPRLLLADEPTGNLDQTNSEAITELLIARTRETGSALVVVTHDPRVATRMDRVLHMRDGVILDSDEPSASTGTLRRRRIASGVSGATSSATRKASRTRRASSVVNVRGSPLCTMARRNGGRRLAVHRCSTDPPPADSPNTVTASGSPPNAAAWVATHSSAAAWSRRPQLPTASSASESIQK